MKAVTTFSSLLFASAVLATPTYAYEAGDIIIRAGVTTVDPQESSDPLALNGTTLSLAGGTTKLGVDSSTQLGLTASYFINQNWAVELLAATPFDHDATATGELAGLKIADVKQLPPTLSAIYYIDSQSAFKPYVGAGINYTIFFEEDITSEADAALSGLGLTGADVELDNSWGVSFQVGADYEINKNWLLNASVRWIDIDTEATVKFDSGDKLAANIEIDPYVYTVSVGYTF